MRINEGMEFVCLSLFGPMSIHSSQVRRFVLDVPTPEYRDNPHSPNTFVKRGIEEGAVLYAVVTKWWDMDDGFGSSLLCIMFGDCRHVV